MRRVLWACGLALLLAACGGNKATPTPTPTAVTVPAPAGSAAPAPTSTPAPAHATYTVQKGDTLSAIAARNHTSVAEIAQLNTLTDPNKLAVGQKLILPAPAPVAPSSSGSPASGAPTSGSAPPPP
ncbi:MAG: LysM peptidoglycan-binding domain-containing protein [Chloroflexota bacterium]